MTKLDLVSHYHNYFRIVAADSEELRQEVYRLRYNIYCQELGWEESALFPGGLEFDQYDKHSEHCLLQQQKDGAYIGCVRLVRADPNPERPPIPLAEKCPGILAISELPRNTFGEISRLALEQKYRSRPGERGNPGGATSDEILFTADEDRRYPHLALKLYLGAAASSIGTGVSGVFAMMEPRLARLLRASGIRFQQVGEAVTYRGIRAPFYIIRDDLFSHLRPEFRLLLEAIQDDLGMAGSSLR